MDVLVPDRIGEVVGWRAWKVIGEQRFPLLASVTHSGTVWHPDRWTFATCRGEARCQGPDPRCPVEGGSIPGEGHSCGLYAAASRAQLVELGYARPSRYAKPGGGEEVVFIGEVGFAGKIVPGTQGWRAQKGRIVRLYVPFFHWRYVEPLEELYRVPVVLENTTKLPKEVSDDGDRD
jgi:hypothetical protein